jgi:hypothetical protein
MKTKLPFAGTSPLTKKLPPIKPYKLSLGHAYAFSDQYGAFHTAAEYCGVSGSLRPPGMWQHGVFGPWDQYEPGSIMYYAPTLGKIKSFVARQDEKQFLNQHGIENCEAIGMPIVYVTAPRLRRLEKTLLVVPLHTVAGVPLFNSREKIKKYCEEIKNISRSYRYTAVCLHYGDIKNQYWLREFHQIGIDFILGGHPRDLNSNQRQAHLYSLFENVTTNGWGSHVPYALSFGAKVSIWGSHPEVDLDIAKRDVGGGGEARVKRRLSAEHIAARNLFLRGLQCHPREAATDKPLGDFLIGRARKRSPSELKSMFLWN